MELDWVSVALRFGLYAVLTAVFGVPLFNLYALRPEERPTTLSRAFPIVSISVLLGIVLSIASLIVMAKNMTGAADYRSLENHAFGMILQGTDFGTAWMMRMAALVVCVLGLLMIRFQATLACLTIAAGGGIALASLAWAGHGAMDEGIRGYLHFSADIVHLIAAGAWIGALISFLMLSRAVKAGDDFEMLARTSKGFAATGTVIVTALVLTGGINYYLIAGTDLQLLYESPYGRFLLLKLGFFGIMLFLAALNRYKLAPRIEAAVASGDVAAASVDLRKSLRLEFSCTVAILFLVAIFGMLSPQP
jgi:putative copper resistance protein D